MPLDLEMMPIISRLVKNLGGVSVSGLECRSGCGAWRVEDPSSGELAVGGLRRS